MVFATSSVSLPPTILDPGSCQAEHIELVCLTKWAACAQTPEWIAEQEEQQFAYEQRAANGASLTASRTYCEFRPS